MVRERMQVLVPSCKAVFSTNTEDRAPFGPLVAGTGEKEFKYTDQSEFGCAGSQCAFVGPTTGLVYEGGGYLKQLPSIGERKTRDTAVTMIKQLHDSLFIDRYTSAIFVESVVYDTARNALGLVRLALELPPSVCQRMYMKVSHDTEKRPSETEKRPSDTEKRPSDTEQRPSDTEKTFSKRPSDTERRPSVYILTLKRDLLTLKRDRVTHVR